MTKDAKRVIDLDALRAAKGETEAGPVVRIGGKDYQLPAQLPASFIFDLGQLQNDDLSKLEDIMRVLFGESFQEVAKLMTVPDINELMSQLLVMYGSTLGESSGLPATLANTGEPTKQT